MFYAECISNTGAPNSEIMYTIDLCCYLIPELAVKQ